MLNGNVERLATCDRVYRRSEDESYIRYMTWKTFSDEFFGDMEN